MNEIIQISALSESNEIQIIYIWYINHVFFNNIFNFNYLLREEVLLSYYRLNIMQLNVSDSIMPDSEHEQDLKYKSVWHRQKVDGPKGLLVSWNFDPFEITYQ